MPQLIASRNYELLKESKTESRSLQNNQKRNLPSGEFECHANESRDSRPQLKKVKNQMFILSLLEIVGGAYMFSMAHLPPHIYY